VKKLNLIKNGLIFLLIAVTCIFPTSNPGHAATLFSDDFNDGNANGWTSYDGTWAVESNEYSVVNGASIAKSIPGATSGSSFTLEGDVKIVDGGQASLIFDVSSPGIGNDALKGYAAGIDTNNTVWAGKFNNNWTSLGSAAMTITAGTWYHLKIVVTSGNFKIYVNGTLGLNINDSTYTTGGSIGVRGGFNNHIHFDNILLSDSGSSGGVAIDSCDSATGWSSGNTLSVNTTDKKEGTGSLQAVGSGTDEFSKLFTPINTGVSAANGYLQFWYYVSDVTKFSAANQVELGSGGAPDVYEYNWSLSGLVNGWNFINLKISNATTTGGTPNLNAINWFRIYHFKTASITTKIDDIRMTDSGTATATPTPTPTPTPATTPTPTPTTPPGTFSDNFDDGNYNGWTTYGTWSVQGGQLRGEANSNIFYGNYGDFVFEGDVSVSASEKRSGIVFRATNLGAGDSFKGYFAFLRISSDRVRLELERVNNGRTHLCDEMTLNVVANTLYHMKVACQGSNIWIYINDMTTPAIYEYDTTSASGAIGFKSVETFALFDNALVSNLGTTPRAPLVQDWSWVRGAVFVASNCVNATQTMEQYNSAVIDRELSYAQVYGFNAVQIYLHWMLYDTYGQTFLNNFEDFLQRANKYGIKVIPIFYDDCGNVDPPHLAPYNPPTPGIHNSQMNTCPGNDLRDNHYSEFKARLQSYVQAVVNAHKTDARIMAWETCNEPIKNQPTQTMVADAYSWIKATGTTIPVIATSGGFLGGKYSDFYTFHVYDGYYGADGGSEHLNTECLNRRADGTGQNFSTMMDYFTTRQTGFMIWDLMIGRDNCRFPWGSPLNAPEPTVPFHGFIYPDGHPWSLAEAQKLKGNDLSTAPVFNVEYFTGNFATSKKVTVTPRIDFDLGNESGTGSPDASAGIGIDNFSIRWTGKVLPATTGTYTFYADSDNIARLWIGTTQVINKTDNTRREVSGTITLNGSQLYDLKVEYVHNAGDSSMHVQWSEPSLSKQVLLGRR
jgi:hypothetical protein